MGKDGGREEVPAVQCVCLEQCLFFNDRMRNMPTTAGVLKHQYCLGEWMECARYVVFKEFGREAVPPDLFPDETERVSGVLAVLRGAL